MRNLLKSFHLPKENFSLFLLFFLYLTTIGTLYSVGATAAETLFVSHYSGQALQQALAWIYIGMAFMVMMIASCYDFFIHKFSRVRLLIGAQIIFALFFVIFRQLMNLGTQYPLVYFFFFIVIESVSLFNISLFYSYLGDYFDTHQARRLYSYIAGGIALGSLLAGWIVVVFVKYFKVDNLIYLCAFFFLINIIYIYGISRIAVPKQVIDPEKETKPLRLSTMFADRYIQNIFVLIFFVILCATLTESQLLISASKIMTEEQLANFFGKFFACLGATQLIVQFFLANWLMVRFGVLKNLYILPSLLAFAIAGYFIQNTFIWSAAIFFTYLACFETLDLVGRELLFLPLSARLRIRSQAIANGVFSSLGRILGGVILLILGYLSLPVHYYVEVLAVCVVLWMLCLFLISSPYKHTLAQSINRAAKFLLGLDILRNLLILLNTKEARQLVSMELSSTDPETSLILLELLPQTSLVLMKPQIISLIASPHPALQLKCLEILGKTGKEKDIKFIEPFMGNADPKISAIAIAAYCALKKKDALPKIKAYLDHPNHLIQLQAVLGSYASSAEGQALAEKIITRILQSDRLFAAQILPQLPDDKFQKKLKELLQDTDLEVRREAIITCQKFPNTAYIEPLIENLIHFPALNIATTNALYQLPESAEYTLLNFIEREDLPVNIRSILLRILGKIGNENSAEAILEILYKRENELLMLAATEALRAVLNKKPIFTKLFAKLELCVEDILNVLTLLICIDKELQKVGVGNRMMLSDTIYFYSNILFTVLSAQYGVKELLHAPNYLLDKASASSTNTLEVLEAVLPRKKYLAIKELYLLKNQSTEDNVQPATLDQQFNQCLLIDCWVRATLLYEVEDYQELTKGVVMTDQDNELIGRIKTAAMLKNVEIFNAVPANYLMTFFEFLHEQTLEKNEYLFKQGDVGNSLYLVISGSLSVQINNQEIAQLAAGACLGEMSLLDKEPRSASMQALESTQLMRIDGDDFTDILYTYPEVAQKLLIILSQRLRKFNITAHSASPQ